MNTPLPSPDDPSAFPTPAEEIVSLGDDLHPDEYATPLHLPSPLDQFQEGLAQQTKQIVLACARFAFDDTRSLIDEAVSILGRAEVVLTPPQRDSLPSVASFRVIERWIDIVSAISAVRAAAVLHLGDGWPLWSESGALFPSLQAAVADIQSITSAPSALLDGLERIRAAFYDELRTRRPATYGHPLLDPKHLRD